LKRIWKETIEAAFKLLFQGLLGEGGLKISKKSGVMEKKSKLASKGLYLPTEEQGAVSNRLFK
jgi:hypothetical protein